MMYLFPSDYLTAKSYLNGKIEVTKHTYTIHHFAASWHGMKHKLFRCVSGIIGRNMAHKVAVIFKKLRLVR